MGKRGKSTKRKKVKDPLSVRRAIGKTHEAPSLKANTMVIDQALEEAASTPLAESRPYTLSDERKRELEGVSLGRLKKKHVMEKRAMRRSVEDLRRAKIKVKCNRMYRDGRREVAPGQKAERKALTREIQETQTGLAERHAAEIAWVRSKNERASDEVCMSGDSEQRELAVTELLMGGGEGEIEEQDTLPSRVVAMST